MSHPTPEMEIEEQLIPTYAARVQRWLPWMRMLRGFRMAIDPRRLVLALLAVWIWSAGEAFLRRQPFSPVASLSSVPLTTWPGEPGAAYSPPIIDYGFPEERKDQVDNLLENLLPEADSTEARSSEKIRQISPYRLIDRPISSIFWPMLRAVNLPTLLSPTMTLNSWIFWNTSLLWGLVVSFIFGGAISRMAAVDFAHSREISIAAALRFSLSHWMSYLGAPLIASVGVTACWLFLLASGLFANIPMIGEILVALVWGVMLLAGFVMVLMLLGIGLGWPLMFAAISTESSDAFDGLSRAWSYLFNRPWYALFLGVFTLVYGTLLLVFVNQIVEWTGQLAWGAFDVGFAGDASNWSFHLLSNPVSPSDDFSVVRGLVMFWTHGVLRAIPTAFAFSYFWTMMTIIYFLLRRREDATPLDEVGGDQEGSGLPVVGIAAAELREKQRQEAEQKTTEEANETSMPD